MKKYFNKESTRFCQISAPFTFQDASRVVYQPFFDFIQENGEEGSYTKTADWSSPDWPRAEFANDIAEKIENGTLVAIEESPLKFTVKGPSGVTYPKFGGICYEEMEKNYNYLFVSDSKDIFQVVRIEHILLSNVAIVKCFGNETPKLMIYQPGTRRYFIGAESYHDPLCIDDSIHIAAKLGYYGRMCPARRRGFEMITNATNNVNEFGLHQITQPLDDVTLFFTIDPHGYVWVITAITMRSVLFDAKKVVEKIETSHCCMTLAMLAAALEMKNFNFKFWKQMHSFKIAHAHHGFGRFIMDSEILRQPLIFTDSHE